MTKDNVIPFDFTSSESQAQGIDVSKAQMFLDELSATPEMKSATASSSDANPFAEAERQNTEAATTKKHNDEEQKKARAVKNVLNVSDWLSEPDEPSDPIIEGLMEVGSMAAIVGPAKAAKSWLAIQLAICISSGVDFLGRKVKQQRVYYANLEIAPKQFKKRVRSICRALEINPESLRDWMFVDNLKNETATWEHCRFAAEGKEAKVAFLDPFYQVFDGEENSAEDCRGAIGEMKKYLADGLTLFVVFHAPKGKAGERSVVDLIAGHSTLVRYPENEIAILPHKNEKTARVVDCSILRDYEPPDPFCVRLQDGALTLANDLEAIVDGGHQPRKSPEEKEAEKIARETKLQGDMSKAVSTYLDERGADIPSVTTLKYVLRGYTSNGEPDEKARWRFAKNPVEEFVKEQIGAGVLKKQQELTQGGHVKQKKDGGHELISTPDRVNDYVNAMSGKIEE